MVKKPIGLVTIAIMLFGLLGLTACTPEEQPTKEFFTLQEAYDEGLLTIDNLRDIAYYYHNSDDGDYIPSPKIPSDLDSKTKDKIKKEYLKTLNIPQSLSAVHHNGIQLLDYYGIYDNAIVIKITDNYIAKDLQLIDYNVAGIVFKDYAFNIRVWR